MDHVGSRAQTVIITNCHPNLPNLGHRDRIESPGVSQLVAEVGEAGDIEVAGLDVEGVKAGVQLAGNLDGESLGVAHTPALCQSHKHENKRFSAQ